MARPRAITIKELTDRLQFRVQIVKWNERCHMVDVEPNCPWVALRAARTTDTINEESLEVKGLFFDLIRHSASGVRPGYLVMGDNKKLNTTCLAKIFNITTETLLPALKRLMLTNKIKLYVTISKNEK